MSTKFLLEHFGGCNPLSPCLSCRAVAFLKEKLSPTDFQHLVEMAGSKGQRVLTDDAEVDELGLSIRSANCLKAENINTVGELCEKTQTQLLVVPNLGRRSLREIETARARRTFVGE